MFNMAKWIFQSTPITRTVFRFHSEFKYRVSTVVLSLKSQTNIYKWKKKEETILKINLIGIRPSF